MAMAPASNGDEAEGEEEDDDDDESIYPTLLYNIDYSSHSFWVSISLDRWTLQETRLATAQKSTSAYCSKVSAHLPS